MRHAAATGLVVSLVFVLAPAAGRAQSAPLGVVRGDTVRVTGPGSTITAVVVTARIADTLEYTLRDRHDVRLTLGPSVKVSVLRGRQSLAGPG